MKKTVSFILFFIIAVMLPGCAGASKPTADEAKAYVQAVLDLVCTGDYDHSTEIPGIENGRETEMIDQFFKDGLQEALNDADNLTEAQKKDFTEILTEALGKGSYTVKDAVETKDGGYDVTVGIEPLRLFDGIDEKLQMKIDKNIDTLMALSGEELNSRVIDMTFDALRENIKAANYGDTEKTVVHYCLIDEENSLYGIDEDAGALLGKKLFSAEDS